jgi:hypothetical protein
VPIALPVLVFAAATLGMALLVEPFLAWYYQWAWWSYILAADGLNRRLAGRSLLRDEPRRFLWLALVSVALWTLFEALNLRLGDWYYVMDDPRRAVRWVGGGVAFATVLPALFETESLLRHLGPLRRVRVAPWRWTRARTLASVTVGAACFALPLAWPDRFFPLTWASFVFLLEPGNRRHASESRLRELEHGDAAPTVRWLIAGLACGALWESCNYWARVKWVYTVPGFESLKVFEMPLAGFLGFPPFALECAVIVAFLDRAGERVRGLARPWRRLVVASATLLAAAATLAVFAAADGVTVDSYYAPVAGLEVLPAHDRQALVAAGLDSPERLLRALRDDAGLARWSARTGLVVEALRRDRERVALVLHRGLGEQRAEELAQLGIETRADLAGWRPAELAAALRRSGAHGPDRFLERRVRVWLQGTARGASGHQPGSFARPPRPPSE